MNIYYMLQIAGILFYLTFILWLLHLTKKTLFFVYLWQLKEYRWDRMKDYLSTKAGRKSFVNYAGAVSLGIMLLTVILISQPFGYLFLSALALCWYGFLNLRTWRQWRSQTLKLPVMTNKALVMLGGVALLVLGLIIWWGSVWWRLRSSELFLAEDLFFILALELLMPIIVSVVMVAVWPISYFMKLNVLNKARTKMFKTKVKVIGITGSYGKTGTKELLAHILKNKFRVLKTAEHVNSELGVAYTILNELQDQEIFIVEMGAYRRGEIADLCKMTRPVIGVLTGINEQHAALFGDAEKIIKAKAELLLSLPRESLAVVNGDSPAAQKAAAMREPDGRTEFYSLSGHGSINADKITVGERGLDFALQLKNSQAMARVSLLGREQALNVLAAAAVAEELGMTATEIADALRDFQPLKGTMRPLAGLNGALLIDDTYNANPDGVRAAFEFLNSATAREKIIVLDDVQELGKSAPFIHRELARAAAANATQYMLIGEDFAELMAGEMTAQGIEQARLMVTTDPVVAATILKPRLAPDTTVLLEGRAAAKLLPLLTP